MFRMAYGEMKDREMDFLFSGEVLGERPCHRPDHRFAMLKSIPDAGM